MTHDYDDAYGTCKDTYATLRIFSDDLDPAEITALLGAQPTETFRRGEVRTRRPLAKNPTHPTNGWFYSSKDVSTSLDCRRHLDIVIEGALKNVDALVQLRRRGCNMDLTVFYSYTQGGPTISPAQMKALAEADIDVWWDLYRAREDEVGDAGA